MPYGQPHLLIFFLNACMHAWGWLAGAKKSARPLGWLAGSMDRLPRIGALAAPLAAPPLPREKIYEEGGTQPQLENACSRSSSGGGTTDPGMFAVRQLDTLSGAVKTVSAP